MQAAPRNLAPFMLLAALLASAAAQQTQPLHYRVQPGATVTLVNDYGPITVTGTAGNQVTVSASPQSPQAQVAGSQSGNGVEVHTHYLSSANQSPPPVSYQVQVPADASLTLRSAAGDIAVQNVRGPIVIESGTGNVEVRGCKGAPVKIRNMDGSVRLIDVQATRLGVRSIGGSVGLDNVGGPEVAVTTNDAPIHFSGSCAAGDRYTLATHSGDIDVALPGNASVAVNAESAHGQAQDAFQLKPDSTAKLASTPGHSFAGKAAAGAASMVLRSFSGKITLHKQ